MAHFISDHSPMDDFQRMLQQVDYTIDNEIAASGLACNNRESLDKKKTYRTVFALMKLCLVLTAVSFVIACVVFIIYSKRSSNMTLRNVALFSMLAIPFCLILALVLGGVGAYMESHSASKDKTNVNIKRHKTSVLLNGNIAVYDAVRYTGSQMLIKYVMDSNNITEVPFNRMYIIDKVYSIKRRNNKLIAVVDATEYFLSYPFVSEYPDQDKDNVERYFNYYIKRTHTNIEWDENMSEINKLIYALNVIK